jgi:hypothetical protein
MRLVFGTVVLVCAAAAATLNAQVPGEKTVDGLVVRIGLADSTRVAKHAPAHGEQRMHGGPKRGEADHIVVSIADANSGRPIGDAEVVVAVDRSGVSHVRRKLDPMPLDIPSYGGWFDLRPPWPYRITVEVVRPGVVRKASVPFDMKNR